MPDMDIDELTVGIMESGLAEARRRGARRAHLRRRSPRPPIMHRKHGAKPLECSNTKGGIAMDALKRLLKDLGGDANLVEEYERDPDSVMKERSLPDEAREAMKRKDLDAVRRLSGLGEVHLTNSSIKSHD